LAGLKATNGNTPIHILHVDDDPSIQEITKLMLQDLSSGFAIDWACCVDEGLKKLASGHYDVVVSDYEMPQKDGLQFLTELRAKNNQTPFILFTGKGREEVAIKALNLGADGYYNKQGNPETVYGELVYGILQSVQNNRVEMALHLSEEKFRVYVVDSPVAFFVVNEDGKYVDVNEAACSLLGYSRDELLELGIVNLLFEKDLAFGLKQFGELRETGRSRFEVALKKKDRQPVYVILNATRLPDGKLMSFCENITERKKVEEALSNSEAKLMGIVECSSDQIFLLDKNLEYLMVNSSLATVLGRSPEEIIGKSIGEVYGLGTATQFSDNIKTVFKIGKSMFLEEKMQAQGQELFISSSLNPIKDDLGNVTAVSGIVRDITERKINEAKQQQSEEQFRQLFSNMPSAVAVYEAVDGGADFIFLDFNTEAEKIEKICRDNVIGKRVTEVFPGVKAFGIFSVFQRVYQSGKPEYYPETLYKDEKDPGTWRENWVYKLPNGNIVAIYNDSTERRIAEETLRESEARFQALYSSNFDAVLVSVPSTGEILMANQAACQMFGMTEEELKRVGRSGIIVSDKQVKLTVEKLMKDGKVTAEFTYKRKDGSTFEGEAASSIFFNADGTIRTNVVIRNITERKNLELALRASEEKFRSCVEVSPVAVFVANPEGKNE
jgi:PAS domain S-box-containing protein